MGFQTALKGDNGGSEIPWGRAASPNRTDPALMTCRRAEAGGGESLVLLNALPDFRCSRAVTCLSFLRFGFRI